MKTIHLMKLLIVLASSLFILSSCNKEKKEGETCYWDNNALFFENLNGKVKTITDTYSKTSFNEAGNITSVGPVNGSEWGTTYSYDAAGRITSIVETYGKSVTTTSFTYEDNGKYIPRTNFHLYETGLIYGQKSITIGGSNTQNISIVVDGDKVYEYLSYEDGKDTIVFTYSGKYPVSCEREFEFMKDITYDKKGMMISYTEGFRGDDYLDTRVNTFIDQNGHMLKVKYAQSYVSGSDSFSSTVTYKYDEHNNMISSESTDGAKSESQYVYDAQGNWTTCKSRNYFDGAWQEWYESTRTIEYYN